MSDSHPVVPGKVYGLRAWQVVREAGDRDFLHAAFQDLRWPHEGPLEASCLTSRGHDAPVADCSCGIYALHPGERALEELPTVHVNDDGMSVVGIIEAWGRLEVHATGFRAQFARPFALVLFDGTEEVRAERIRRLARAYGAELIQARDGADLIRHCAENNLGLSGRAVSELLEPALVAARRRAQRLRRRSIVKRSLGATAALGATVLAGSLLWSSLPPLATEGLAADGAPRTSPDDRRLVILEQAVLRHDGGHLYVARVKNTHPTKTALGVVSAGSLLARDASVAGEVGFDVDERPQLAPGQTGVVIDFMEDSYDGEPEVTATVASFETKAAARVFRTGRPRSPVSVSRVRVDRRRCLLLAEVRSTRRFLQVGVIVVLRDAKGGIGGAVPGVAGPLKRGRNQQVLERLDPVTCRGELPKLEAYPDLTVRQLRAGPG